MPLPSGPRWPHGQYEFRGTRDGAWLARRRPWRAPAAAPARLMEALAVRAIRSFHSATSHRRSRVMTALTELPTSSRAAGVDSMSRACSPQPAAAREAAQPSQEGAARGPSGACRAAVRRVGVKEGGHLAYATDLVSGGFSLPNARGARYTSRTCSSRPLS